MSTSLHTLTAPQRRGTKRLGRGNSSGRGAYSGRGMKGQNARSGGGHGIQARSLKSLYQRIPKKKGFRSFATGNMRIINLRDLDRYFKGRKVIRIVDYHTAGLMSGLQRRVKILGSGTLQRAIVLSAHNISASARQAIEQAGGTVKIVSMVGNKRQSVRRKRG